MPSFPTLPRQIAGLAPIVDSWSRSSSLHSWNPGARPEAIAAAEAKAGQKLPTELRAIYELSDGLSLLRGNLNFWPLKSEKHLCVATIHERHREWGQSYPDEILLFGDNGSEHMFGLWVGRHAIDSDPHPVIEFGESSEPNAMAIAGTDLIRFLIVRTAYYLNLYAGDGMAPANSYGPLGLPSHLHDAEPTDELMCELYRWGDPSIPDIDPDPYSRGWDLNRIREWVESRRQRTPT